MVTKKIKTHFEQKSYIKIARVVGKMDVMFVRGYIVGYSDDFLILQETDDFRLLGYMAFPISQIKKIRFNKWDKYYTNIMIWEGEAENIGIKHKIDLADWNSIFTSIKEQQLNVIVECEDQYFNSFTIGPIVKATRKNIHIQDFDPSGLLDAEPTAIKYKNISRVKFDDRYINVFSKYLRHREVDELVKK